MHMPMNSASRAAILRDTAASTPSRLSLSSSAGKLRPKQLWGTGFLPSDYQGVLLRSQGDPVLYLNNPAGVSRKDRRSQLDALAALNQSQHEKFGDPEILERLKQHEMAYRMQASVPELMDLSKESDRTFELYGEDARTPGTFAACCLNARRLAERGVRNIQIFHRGWDAHGNLVGEHGAQIA